MITYRNYEILKTLQEQPSLTTAKLLKECLSKPGSELPNSVDVISKLIYSMRQSGLLTTSYAVGGKVHNITQKGIDDLIEYEDDESSKRKSKQSDIQRVPDESAKNTQELVQKEPEAAQDAPLPDEKVEDTEKTLDELLAQIRSISTKPAMPAIRDKEKKIATLLKIGALMHDDIAAVIEDVIDDLERA